MRSLVSHSRKIATLALTVLVCETFTSSPGSQLINSSPFISQSGCPAAASTRSLTPLLNPGFEVNKGQERSDARFIFHGSRYNLLLTDTGAVFLPLRSPSRRSSGATARDCVRMEFADSKSSPRISGLDQLSNTSSHFTGNNPAEWLTSIPHYARVMYEDLYHGVDLVYLSNRGELEYDVVLRPGANAASIRLNFHGADKMRVDPAGDLVLDTPDGEIRQKTPLAYQLIRGLRKEVSAKYAILDGDVVCYRLGNYDRSEPLIIDPILQYSSYLGAAGRDEGNAIGLDASGSIYVAGLSDSSDTDRFDSFVIRLSPDGASPIYSVHLGDCEVLGLTVDPAGNVYLTGQAGPDFAVTSGAFQSTPAGGSDAFVAKLDPSGSVLLFSTLIGGSDDDRGLHIAVDSTGSASVCGDTQSMNFPSTSRAFQPAYAGGSFDAFVARLNPTGTALVYSTYLGGEKDDRGQGIALDSEGNAYVTGSSDSGDFPETAGAYSASHLEFFVTKLRPDGSSMAYSVYGIGGRDIAVDSNGSAYVVGTTDSKKLATTGKALRKNRAGGLDAFVAKLDSDGADAIFATYLGGEDNDYGSAIGIDSEGNCYVIGTTESRDFPSKGSLQPDYGGFSDAYVTEVNAEGTAVIYSTLLGGGDADLGKAIAVIPNGTVFVTGSTRSLGFPTASPLQSAKGAGAEFDAFVARLEPSSLAPRIDSAEWSDGKLFLTGANFDFGPTLLIDGKKVSAENDANEPAARIFTRNARKKIQKGETVMVQVKNTDGMKSNEIAFTRPLE